MDESTNFAHRRNSDSSYDSICLRCYATAGWAKKEESLSSPESTHVCDPSALYLVNQGSIPESIPTLGLIAWSSREDGEGSVPIRYQKFPLKTKLRLTVKPGRTE